MSCDYQYDIQPAQIALSCSKLMAFALQCQVSSDESDFSIIWHHSTSEPDSSNILSAVSTIDDSRSDFITTVWIYSPNTTMSSLTSELRRREIHEKDNIDGFYWCSVNSSNDTNTTTPNPSVVLHILNRIDCTTKVESVCEGAVNFYSTMFSESTPRCADHNTSVDIVEAQNCTTGDRIELITEYSNTGNFVPKSTDGSGAQNDTSTSTLTVTIKAPTLPLTLGIITGASMGGLILVLFIVIGLLLICMMKMKTNKNQKGRNQVDSTTPFDNIQMYSSAPTTSKNETDESSRVSRMFLESNISYECPQDIVTTSQINENVYACIH